MDPSGDIENFRRHGLDGRGRGGCKGGLRERGVGPVELSFLVEWGTLTVSLDIRSSLGIINQSTISRYGLRGKQLLLGGSHFLQDPQQAQGQEHSRSALSKKS